MAKVPPAMQLSTEVFIFQSGVSMRQTINVGRAGQGLRAYNSRRQQHSQAPRRGLHSTAPVDVSIPLPISEPTTPVFSQTESSADRMTTVPALSSLRLAQILRTYLITSISSSPSLLNASTKVLRSMLESNNPFFDLRNPFMTALLSETFYKQFCAGENRTQVAQACDQLRQQGYAGVILEYALEVLKDAKSDEAEDISIWRKGMLDTVDVAAEGDFVALKWSGMGPAAMQRMKKEQPPSKDMEQAMHAVCKSAAAKGVTLLPSAEETWSLNGFHKWSVDLQRVYNLGGKSVVYSTYQAYLKQNAAILARHLECAKTEGFTLGIKLVRGAYLESEKRDLIWPTIESTHHAYDTTTSALIHRQYNDFVKPSGPGKYFPDINVVIASHNAVTVEKAQAWRQTQAARNEELTPLVFAQLQGMADEVSCTLLAAARASQGVEKAVQEKVFKHTNWGTMQQCLNYLLRRAAENKDAAGRTKETRNAMRSELWRRSRAGVGLA